MVHIMLVEIVNRNYGDGVIAANTRRFVEQAIPKKQRDNVRIHSYNITSQDYDLVAKMDMVIFVGGGIVKFQNEKFYFYISKLVEFADSCNIPVYFNAVGVESYDAEDERCQALKKVLNLPCVKGISVRDDIDTLRRCYLTGGTPSWLVRDPAVYSATTYGITRDKSSDVIGLGVIRSAIFADYGHPEITEQVQLDWWCGVIRLLEKKGYRYQLFTNGLKADYDFALQVLKAAGKEKQAATLLARRAASDRELMETIASYRGIIAGRMHSTIIAYALGIPAVGLVWIDKLRFFGERIGYPERFLLPEDITAERLVERLEKALHRGVRRRRWPNGMARRLTRFVRCHLKEKTRKSTVDWSDYLVAEALGGMAMQFGGTNSPEALQTSIEAGYRFFEADVRLTSDKIPVCVNGWSKGTYQKLELPESVKSMPYGAFIDSKYIDGHFQTQDLSRLLLSLGGLDDWTLILDIGIPAENDVPTFVEKLREVLDSNPAWYERCIVRVQRESHAKAFAQSGKPFRLMAYLPEPKVQEEKGITPEAVEAMCDTYGIEWIGVHKNALCEQVRQTSRKTCLFSYQTYGEIRAAVESGIDLVVTSYIKPNDINGL